MNLEFEEQAWQKGWNRVVGIDEVGRGCWAGPLVMAAFCINEKQTYQVLPDIKDSKKISVASRARLYDAMAKDKVNGLVEIELAEASASTISKHGLGQAVKDCLRYLVDKFDNGNTFFYLDGGLNPRAYLDTEKFEVITRGDDQVYSIAAAAVYAKVYRDNVMIEAAQRYPGYKFESNVGYGTKEHREGLARLGVTAIHRQNYKPIRDLL